MAHPVIAPRRQARKERLLSFRPTGEIFLRSLVARDDGPRPVTLATFAPLRESQSFRFPLSEIRPENFKYLWLEFILQLLYYCSYARFRPAMSILSICIIAFITLFDFSASL